MNTKHSSSEEYHKILGIVPAKHCSKCKILQSKKDKISNPNFEESICLILIYRGFYIVFAISLKNNVLFYFDFIVIHYNCFIKMAELDYVLTSL